MQKGTTEQCLHFLNQGMQEIKYHSTVVTPVERNGVEVKCVQAVMRYVTKQENATTSRTHVDEPGGNVFHVNLQSGKQFMTIKPEVIGESRELTD